uniref:Uncharacterized protein n=2 Tax=Rousettus aegyptiacus TaxID=9407 RepID=A0A7J8CI53_ROUAE|nr:hypothetical protein HJG63_009065 [Rousettus aegyptiacus]
MRHPCISVREKEHIMPSLAQQPTSPKRSVPIKAMVRCLPLWAIFTGFFSHFWLCTIVVTYLPTYIRSVLHVNLRGVSSLPTRHRIGSRHDGNWFIASRHTPLCPGPVTLAATAMGLGPGVELGPGGVVTAHAPER